MTFYVLRRRWKKAINKTVFAIDEGRLAKTFDEIGMAPGATVCVHSALSKSGHFTGGAKTVLDALHVALGPTGTILMPSFPIVGSTERYLRSKPVYDVKRTPSNVGLLTEVFRQQDGTRRSLHPTNPLAGCGPLAAEILMDHDLSETPFGYGTPYGRLAALDNSFILMIETHVHSLLHHIQERVDFPNMYLDDPQSAEVVDWNGNLKSVRTRVMRRRIPYFVAVPGTGAQPDWAILHDFALMFPKTRCKEAARLGYTFPGYPRLSLRRKTLERAGLLRSSKLGRGEVGLLRIKPFVDLIEKEFRESIGRYPSAYRLENLTSLNLRYS